MTRHAGDVVPFERPLTPTEHDLTKWMLLHGRPDAQAYLPQLTNATVASQCPCGCASIDFKIRGQRAPVTALEILGDYLFGGPDDLAGAFVFACGGVLAGLEVYGLARDHPKELPHPTSLRLFAPG